MSRPRSPAQTRSRFAALAALACTLGLALTGLVAPSSAQAQSGAPPAGFVAPAEPQADESNAARGKSQPGNNAPLWRAVRESGTTPGTTSLPGAELGMLIQPMVQYPGSRFTTAGEAWRQVRNQWLIPYGGSLLLIITVALALFYFKRGALGKDHPDKGLIIERFTPLERAAHWTNAIAFVALAISGIVMAFGKFFLLPILGGTLFGWLTYALKNLHNFVGPLFAVSLVIVLLTFVKDNIATAWDIKWLKKGGGLLGGEEVPSHRFNTLEKGMFWFVILVPGLLVVGSGLILDKLLPGLDYLRGDMQIAHMIHAAAGVLMMAGLLGHIYMGTVGTRGAFKAMKTGYVNEGWAREHHALWLDDVKAGKIPAQRSQNAPPGKPVGGTAPQA